MLSQWIITRLEKAVSRMLEEMELSQSLAAPIKVRVEQPASLEHGDYSTNLAMQLARVLRLRPMQIAEQIRNKLEQRDQADDLIANIEVIPPGFINLFIHWPRWAQRTFTLPEASGDKIVVEHTSINPNKSAHIGHLRNSCIGDTLVRLLRRNGCRVEVHNYIDDLGNQLADTVVGILNTSYTMEYDRFGDYCWDLYSSINKEYEVNPKLLEQRAGVLHALEEGNTNVSWIGLLVAERIVREHIEEMKSFGIEYDLLVWESSLVREGFWSSAFRLLQQTSVFYQETKGKLAGCWVLRSSPSEAVNNRENTGEELEEPGEVRDREHSLDKVLIRSNGILTYTAKDIAYHLWKYGLLDKDFSYKRFEGSLWTTDSNGDYKEYGKADRVINVIDRRQEYPQAVVKQALQELGYAQQAEKLNHVSYGVVSLSPAAAAELGVDISAGKTSYAMSGRQGIGIKISTLLDMMETVIENKRSDKSGLSSRIIAAAAIRYYLLRFGLQTEVVFDLQQATEISGNTGVYLLYSYARAGSLLNKAGKEAAKAEADIALQVPMSCGEMEKAEYVLIRHLSIWLDVLHTAGKELTPHSICTYAHELATAFNNFYAACPILKADSERRPFRIWLTAKFKETLGDALQVLGLPTPERM